MLCEIKKKMSHILMIEIIVLMLCLNGSSEEYLDLPEGASCEWLGVQGTCVSVRRCLSHEYHIKNKTLIPICTFNNKESVVCCVDCSILAANKNILDILDRSFYKTDKKFLKQCFKYQYLLPYTCKTHINYIYNWELNTEKKCYNLEIRGVAPIGSEDALRGDFPHMALLGYGADLDSAQWLCGGSLISERFILTAGHCASSTQFGNVTYIALGMLKRSDPPAYWKRYKVKRFIPHPEYAPPTKYHDIALIETETLINFTDGVRPACLTDKKEVRQDDIAFATGWGKLGPHKENADVMQKVKLQKFSAEECAAQYPSHRHLLRGYDNETQVCYGDHQEVKDTCMGDSGGPLQKRDPDANYCPYAIIGVTSYGHTCGKPGAAGIYTRVSHYVPWIESVVWP